MNYIVILLSFQTFSSINYELTSQQKAFSQNVEICFIVPGIGKEPIFSGISHCTTHTSNVSLIFVQFTVHLLVQFL